MKTIGTLEEIGAQVGDVVESLRNGRKTVSEITKEGDSIQYWTKESYINERDTILKEETHK